MFNSNISDIVDCCSCNRPTANISIKNEKSVQRRRKHCALAKYR